MILNEEVFALLQRKMAQEPLKFLPGPKIHVRPYACLRASNWTHVEETHLDITLFSADWAGEGALLLQMDFS